jgi:hypothetical protein
MSRPLLPVPDLDDAQTQDPTVTAAAPQRPTDRWLAAADGLPALTGPAGTAERLLLLAHYGVDWDSWLGARRMDYWDAIFPERVLQAAIRSANLRRWWQELGAQLMTRPRNGAERREVADLLQAESRPVLEALRWEVQPLVLRVRIVADALRATRSMGTPR